MKKNIYLLLFFIISAPLLLAQKKVRQITVKDQIHYITNDIEYPITGTYLYLDKTLAVEKQKELALSTVLHANGTGTIQNENLEKEKIEWGIECYESGIPILKSGFNSGSYSFWYTKKSNPEGEEWILDTFSIHSNNKMYLSGKRVKEFKDKSE